MSQGATVPASGMIEGPRTTLTPPSPEFVGPMPETTGPMPGVPSGQAPGSPLQKNVGFMQKFASFLGDTPEERTKNAQVFSALVKDLGNVGKTVADSTLMQRMMKEQMGSGIDMVTGGSASGGVGAIPQSTPMAPVMSQLGFR